LYLNPEIRRLFIVTNITKEAGSRLGFGGELLSLGLFDLVDLGLGLVAQAGSAPMLLDFLSALVEVGLHRLDDLVEGRSVSRLDLQKEITFVNFGLTKLFILS
jgi:hypothetical protein